MFLKNTYTNKKIASKSIIYIISLIKSGTSCQYNFICLHPDSCQCSYINEDNHLGDTSKASGQIMP